MSTRRSWPTWERSWRPAWWRRLLWELQCVGILARNWCLCAQSRWTSWMNNGTTRFGKGRGQSMMRSRGCCWTETPTSTWRLTSPRFDDWWRNSNSPNLWWLTPGGIWVGPGQVGIGAEAAQLWCVRLSDMEEKMHHSQSSCWASKAWMASATSTSLPERSLHVPEDLCAPPRLGQAQSGSDDCRDHEHQEGDLQQDPLSQRRSPVLGLLQLCSAVSSPGSDVPAADFNTELVPEWQHGQCCFGHQPSLHLQPRQVGAWWEAAHGAHHGCRKPLDRLGFPYPVQGEVRCTGPSPDDLQWQVHLRQPAGVGQETRFRVSNVISFMSSHGFADSICHHSFPAFGSLGDYWFFLDQRLNIFTAIFFPLLCAGTHGSASNCEKSNGLQRFANLLQRICGKSSPWQKTRFQARLMTVRESALPASTGSSVPLHARACWMGRWLVWTQNPASSSWWIFLFAAERRPKLSCRREWERAISTTSECARRKRRFFTCRISCKSFSLNPMRLDLQPRPGRRLSKPCPRIWWSQCHPIRVWICWFLVLGIVSIVICFFSFFFYPVTSWLKLRCFVTRSSSCQLLWSRNGKGTANAERSSTSGWKTFWIWVTKSSTQKKKPRRKRARSRIRPTGPGTTAPRTQAQARRRGELGIQRHWTRSSSWKWKTSQRHWFQRWSCKPKIGQSCRCVDRAATWSTRLAKIGSKQTLALPCLARAHTRSWRPGKSCPTTVWNWTWKATRTWSLWGCSDYSSKRRAGDAEQEARLPGQLLRDWYHCQPLRVWVEAHSPRGFLPKNRRWSCAC